MGSTLYSSYESVWQDDHSRGWHAEIRGLETNGVYEWLSLGVFGTRRAAVDAIVATRGRKHEVFAGAPVRCCAEPRVLGGRCDNCGRWAEDVH
jgi:hypothetical protein